jgi:uncharacterized protein involved in exopolysaccharide biosynthesis
LRSEIETVDQEYVLATEALKTASREYDAASVNVSSKSQDIKQIAPAQVSERPVRPRILINAMMGFLLGLLVFSGGVVGLQSYRDEYRQGPFDVQEKAVTVNRR